MRIIFARLGCHVVIAVGSPSTWVVTMGKGTESKSECAILFKVPNVFFSEEWENGNVCLTKF